MTYGRLYFGTQKAPGYELAMKASIPNRESGRFSRRKFL